MYCVGNGGNGIISFGPLLCKHVEQEPVSYTHLDVYKRQVQRLKTVSRIDKDLRPAAPRLQHTVVRGSRLDGTAAGGSYACLLYTSRCV